MNKSISNTTVVLIIVSYSFLLLGCGVSFSNPPIDGESDILVIHGDMYNPDLNHGDLGGQLSVQKTTPLSMVDLSSEGTVDWAHWGLNWGTSDILITRKNTTQHFISNFETIGPETIVHQFQNNPITFSWSDGTPTIQNSGTNSIIYIYAKGNGFRLRISASPVEHTLRLYISSYAADCKLTAFMSDGSAVSYSDTIVNNTKDSVHKMYVFAFRSNTLNQILEVSWVDTADYWTGANVSLQAATLE